jgi:hypothetical protein
MAIKVKPLPENRILANHSTAKEYVGSAFIPTGSRRWRRFEFRWGGNSAPSAAQRRGLAAVANQAERAQIVQIALAAALGHGDP